MPKDALISVGYCARYDTALPALVIPAGQPRLLLLEKINGFRDGPSVEAAHSTFLARAKEKRWTIVTTDKGGKGNVHRRELYRGMKVRAAAQRCESPATIEADIRR